MITLRSSKSNKLYPNSNCTSSMVNVAKFAQQTILQTYCPTIYFMYAVFPKSSHAWHATTFDKHEPF